VRRLPRLAAHRLAGAGRTFRAAAHLGHVEAPYDWVYLQDCAADRYLRWDPGQERETEA